MYVSPVLEVILYIQGKKNEDSYIANFHLNNYIITYMYTYMRVGLLFGNISVNKIYHYLMWIVCLLEW